MTTNKITNLHKMVKYFLSENEELRNNDVKLQLALIRHKYPYAFKRDAEGKEYVVTWALDIFTQDNVKRVRAKIQNEEGLYLPTDPAVRKARQIKEEEWQKWLLRERPAVQYWSDTH